MTQLANIYYLLYIIFSSLIFQLLKPQKIKKISILFFTALLVFFLDKISFVIIVYDIILSFLVIKHKIVYRRLYLFATVFFILLPLLFFKYYGSINRQIVTLPIGISYYTFSVIAALIDTYRRKMPKVDIFDYACFVAFFPKLFVGPITIPEDIIAAKGKIDFKISSTYIKDASKLIMTGLIKIIVIANTLNSYVINMFTQVDKITNAEAMIVTLFYGMVIYADFSGAIDIARGAALLFNIELPINFNRPYLARNIQDFWHRWHITLFRFMRNYVYIPLGGNRVSAQRHILNILIIFLLTGLWHGATWNFIVWGLFHGLGVTIFVMLKKIKARMFFPISTIITFLFVHISWIIFRSPDLKTAWSMIHKALFIFNGNFSTPNLQAFYFFKLPLYFATFSYILGWVFMVFENKRIPFQFLYPLYLAIGAFLILFYSSLVTYYPSITIYAGF